MIWLAEILGFIVLLPACLLGAQHGPYIQSIKPKETAKFERVYVDTWKWKWLNKWYANTEDGVSGFYAIVYVDNKGTLGYYSDTFPKWMPEWAIAYSWSAWRNGANNIKRPLRTDGLNRAYPY